MDARTTPTAKKVDTKKLATLAMLSALAFAIMAVSKLLPSVEGFLDFDFKDVVICIAGFVYGPLSALHDSRRLHTRDVLTLQQQRYHRLHHEYRRHGQFLLPGLLHL